MRYLMILEVSQKQAYIFSSTKLKENIKRSENICQVTDIRYFSSIAERAGIPFSKEGNLVYSGGGHTVLEFGQEGVAKAFAYEASKTVKREFPEIALFLKVLPYEEGISPGENLKNLSEELEVKKSIRAASFRQGSFGIERMSASLRKPEPLPKKEERISWDADPEYVPKGYQAAKQFGDLGNSRDSSCFIAVVHIDGNAMGKRVEQIRKKYEKENWNEFKKNLREFSDSVDLHFKEAYQEMADRVAESLKKGAAQKLDLQKGYFPIRKVILAGDDVCFVAEGRIGLEAARIFLEQLKDKRNQADGMGYTACAGVAIVHQKYPFYKAYSLSEMLCSNAKRSIAAYGEGKKACAIDWHLEFGELADTMEELREAYETEDGHCLELRPYLLWAEEEVWKQEPIRRYGNFKKLLTGIQKEEIAYARGKIKEFRTALKAGEKASEYYLKSKLMDEFSMMGFEGIYKEIGLERLFSGQGLERKVFVETNDQKKRSLYFDGIEMIDTFVPLDE